MIVYQYDMDVSLEKLIINKKWKNLLSDQYACDYFIKLQCFLNQEFKKNKIIYPKSENIFLSLNSLDINEIKIVILGQDPYHGENEAHGLSFSVPQHIKIPPSLKNIFKELESDLSIQIPTSGCLSHWADQGVLLLNSVLTVEKDCAGSHRNQGWEIFTDQIISIINQNCEHVVFILWGAYAQKKTNLIDSKKHLIISGVHPSPLSSYRGFFGSKPFSQANAWLASKNIESIKW